MGLCLDLFKIADNHVFIGNGIDPRLLARDFALSRVYPILEKYLPPVTFEEVWVDMPPGFEPRRRFVEQMTPQGKAIKSIMGWVSGLLVKTLPIEKWNDPDWMTEQRIKRVADIIYEFRYIPPAEASYREQRASKRLVEEVGYTETEANISWVLFFADAQRLALWPAPFEMPDEAQIQRFETGLIPREEKEPTYEPEPEPEKIEVELDAHKEVVISEKEEVTPEVGPEAETETFVTEAMVPGVQNLKEYLKTTEGKVVLGLGLFFLLRSFK